MLYTTTYDHGRTLATMMEIGIPVADDCVFLHQALAYDQDGQPVLEQYVGPLIDDISEAEQQTVLKAITKEEADKLTQASLVTVDVTAIGAPADEARGNVLIVIDQVIHTGEGYLIYHTALTTDGKDTYMVFFTGPYELEEELESQVRQVTREEAAQWLNTVLPESFYDFLGPAAMELMALLDE